MTNSVSFPSLGLEFNINPVAFTLPDFLGGLDIYWYGIIIAFGFLCAIFYASKRSRTFGLDPDRVFNVVLVSVIAGVIGARVYYVIFSLNEFSHNWWSIFNMRTGGLGIYGGLVFGFVASFIACRIFKVKVIPMFDLAVGGIILGQAIGRWGNFVNQEAFGANTTLPWGMISPETTRKIEVGLQAKNEVFNVFIDPNLPVHPTFLYESIWCFLGFLLIALLTKRRRFDGQLTLIYIGWYGLGRFFIEGLRADSLMIGSIRISQLVALLSVIFSIVMLALIFYNIRRSKNPNYLPLYVNTPEGQAVINGEFYPQKGEKKQSPKEKMEEVFHEAEEDDQKDSDTDSVSSSANEKKNFSNSKKTENQSAEESSDLDDSSSEDDQSDNCDESSEDCSDSSDSFSD